jgi:hypothetical protein
MSTQELLADIHALEEDLLAFERKYGVRSEVFYAAYSQGEEPENEAWVLDFTEWAGVYRTWLTRLAAYRNEVSSLQAKHPGLAGLVHAAA